MFDEMSARLVLHQNLHEHIAITDIFIQCKDTLNDRLLHRFLEVGWQPIRDKRTVDGAAVRHLHDVSHGVLEEDEIH